MRSDEKKSTPLYECTRNFAIFYALSFALIFNGAKLLNLFHSRCFQGWIYGETCAFLFSCAHYSSNLYATRTTIFHWPLPWVPSMNGISYSILFLHPLYISVFCVWKEETLGHPSFSFSFNKKNFGYKTYQIVSCRSSNLPFF